MMMWSGEGMVQRQHVRGLDKGLLSLEVGLPGQLLEILTLL